MQQILARLDLVPVAAWVLLGVAVVLGYFARPIVRCIRPIPEGKREVVAMIVKSAALFLAVVAVLMAMRFI